VPKNVLIKIITLTLCVYNKAGIRPSVYVFCERRAACYHVPALKFGRKTEYK
jgi:hypothetical protein